MEAHVKLANEIIEKFMLPTICIFSIITNIINLKVFSKLKTKNIIYKYMKYISRSNLIWSFVCFFVFLNNFHHQNRTINLIINLYKIYAYSYLTNVLNCFSIFAEIAISYRRYKIISSKNLKLSIIEEDHNWFDNI